MTEDDLNWILDHLPDPTQSARTVLAYCPTHRHVTSNHDWLRREGDKFWLGCPWCSQDMNRSYSYRMVRALHPGLPERPRRDETYGLETPMPEFGTEAFWRLWAATYRPEQPVRVRRGRRQR